MPRISNPAFRFTLVALALVVVAHLLDPWAQRYISDPDVYSEDWGRLLRVMGFYPLWALMGVAILLVDWPRQVACWKARAGQARRAGLLLLAPALGGLLAEVGKVAFRRLRPGEVPGEYVFRSWAERPLYSGGLGLPSSHTVVAFAAAAMLARLFPRAAPVWYGLAAGCGLTRVAAGAHFLSGVVVGGLVGWGAAWLVWRWNFGQGPEAVVMPRVVLRDLGATPPLATEPVANGE
jgi:membrane-associated phospholipid phosphatase